MDCPLCLCSFPYFTDDGRRQGIDVAQLDENYFQVTWIGDDQAVRGADFYGLGSQQRAFAYAEFVQKAYLDRSIPASEVLNPAGPRYM